MQCQAQGNHHHHPEYEYGTWIKLFMLSQYMCMNAPGHVDPYKHEKSGAKDRKSASMALTKRGGRYFGLCVGNSMSTISQSPPPDIT
jgi:hypothetical protein